jgi:hypothetical protein
VQATDGLGGVASRSYAVRIDPAGGPVAPLITSANGVSVAAGAALSFTVTTSGSPAASLTSSGGLPAGVHFADDGDGTATLAGVPAPGSDGAYVLTLKADNGVGAAATQAFTLTVTAPATTMPGAPPAGTPAIYVANASSVTGYAAGASGDTPPVLTLSGPHTGLSSPAGVALDPSGNLWVSNAGNGTVTRFAPGSSGDAAPADTIGVSHPGGLAVAGDGTVLVASDGAVKAIRNGAVTTVADPGDAVAVALDAAGTVFAAGGGSVTAFRSGTAVRAVAGSASGLAGVTGVAVDPAGQLFVSGAGAVRTFAAGADGAVPPLATSSGLTAPTGVALDQAGETLVTDGDAVVTFASGATSPLRMLAGAHTGLAAPTSVFAVAAPWVRAQPVAPAAVDPGDTVVLTTTISASPACPIAWQVSTGGGAPFTALAGADGPRLTLDNVPGSHDGYRYRATCANAFGSVTTDAVALSVRSAAAVLTDPSDQTVGEGSDATFTAAARGFPAPAVRWQVSTDGGASFADVPGATAATLTVPRVARSADGDRYRAVFTNSGGSATSAAAKLTVLYAPGVTAQPADTVAVPGAPVSFTAHAGGNPAPAVRWQVSTDGGLSFADMAGGTADTLTIARAASPQDGYEFRAVFTNAAGTATSDPATLSVGRAPEVAQDPDDVNATAGDPVVLHARATGLPAPSVQWQASSDGGASWMDLAGQTGSDLAVTAVAGQDGTRYRAVFTNAAGSATSRAATLRVRNVFGSVPGSGGGGPVSGAGSGGGGGDTIIVNGAPTDVVSGSTVKNGHPAALVRIRSTRLDVARTGRRARYVRIRLFCEPKSGRDCTGTVKIRTTAAIDPSSTGGKKAKRKKVTFITFAYSLPRGAVGIASGRLPAEKYALLKRLKSVKVDTLVQVDDTVGHAEIVKSTVRMRTVKTAR